MANGTVSADLARSERINLAQRTSDPSDPAAEDEWLRVDLKPSYKDANGNTQTAVAEYRVQNADGTVSTAPVAQLGDPTGRNVIDKKRFYVNAGGSPTGKGFVPYATKGASYPKRKLEHPAAGTVELHDKLTAIPSSVVSVAMGSVGTNDTGDYGGWIKTSQKWDKFQARFDAGTQLASDEEMVLADTNGTELEVLDASSSSPGDVLTFTTTLSAGSEYAIYGRTPSGEARDEAFTNSVTFPVTSNDGNLDITSGYSSNRTGNTWSDGIQHISEYGSITL